MCAGKHLFVLIFPKRDTRRKEDEKLEEKESERRDVERKMEDRMRRRRRIRRKLSNCTWYLCVLSHFLVRVLIPLAPLSFLRFLFSSRRLESNERIFDQSLLVNTTRISKRR